MIFESYRPALQYFTLVPSERRHAWRSPSTHPFGFLFRYCTPDGRSYAGEKGVVFGCPLSVSRGKAIAWTEEITKELLKAKLPYDAARLRPVHLFKIAGIQRDMDQTFRDAAWRKEHRYALPYAWPDDDFLVEDIDGWDD